VDTSIKAIKITHVAVKTPKEIWSLPRSNRHQDVLRLMSRFGVRDYGKETEGFVDENGKFLNRREAFTLACATGQLNRFNHPPNHYNGDELYSEDLW